MDNLSKASEPFFRVLRCARRIQWTVGTVELLYTVRSTVVLYRESTGLAARSTKS